MSATFFEGIVKLLLVLVFAFTTLIITRRDMLSLFNAYALQSMFLAAIAFVLFMQEQNTILLYTAILTLVSKSVVIPLILKRVQRKMNIHRDVEFHYLQPTGSILLSIAIILAVHLAFSRILGSLPLSTFFSIGVTLGFSLTMIGMTIVFSRKQVISKIVGFLAMENGVVLVSLFIAEMPLLIEVLVLLDLIILVMIAAVLGFGIGSTIEDFHTKINPFSRIGSKEDEDDSE